jgi:VanZ like family
MDQASGTYRKTLGALCVCVVCVILTAGLWPFWAPRNNVHWLQTGDGLEFGHHGSAVSAGAFRNGNETNTSGTLEIGLNAARSQNGGTILSFDASSHPGEPFSLQQFGNSLVVRRNNVDAKGVSRTALMSVPGLFRSSPQPLFLTITLNKRGMSTYVNGLLAGVFPIVGTWNDFTGRLVLANSPTAHNSWLGKINRLAIYRQELAPGQIAGDYASWIGKRKPGLEIEEAPVALYLFNDHEGRVAHNSVDGATDLVIPPRYFVLHPQFLSTPWREYHRTWGYWQDVLINISGFIPFGFCICAYFSLVRWTRRPATATVVLGLLTSLTIELLQVLLPTRSSGMTDLMTNTLGTALGVMIYRSVLGQRLLLGARAAMVRAGLERQEVPSRS